jgi:hypothetical protein
MSLADNVHRLTRPHLTLGPDGKPYAVMALLDQLDRAITASERNGSGGGGESLPISAGALALQQDILQEAAGIHMCWGMPDKDIAAMVKTWPRKTPIEGVDLEKVTAKWIERILEIVAPTKPPRRLTLPCPSCSTLYHEGKPALQVHCYDADGYMLHIGYWTADCRACGAGWPTENMPWLIRALTAQEAEAS